MCYLGGTYTCPDCGAVCNVTDLFYPIEPPLPYDNGEYLMVCPNCGVIQENFVVEPTLGKEI